MHHNILCYIISPLSLYGSWLLEWTLIVQRPLYSLGQHQQAQFICTCNYNYEV